MGAMLMLEGPPSESSAQDDVLSLPLVKVLLSILSTAQLQSVRPGASELDRNGRGCHGYWPR